MKEALNDRALTYACQRVEDFARVNLVRENEDREEAVSIWLESLGLNEDLRRQFAAWVEGFVPGWEGPVYLGFTVGMFVAQYFRDGNA